jgi:hypothetical protein
MTAHNRKLKLITFDIDGTEFQVQCKTWQVVNNTELGEKVYTYALDGEFQEETDDNYSLTATFFADWRSGGISDFLWEHDGEIVDFQIDHHPDISGEHVRWAGEVTLKAPSVGGDVRTTEETAIELAIVGKPAYTRP